MASNKRMGRQARREVTTVLLLAGVILAVVSIFVAINA